VATLEVADEVGLNDAVTPVGAPDAAKVTLPENGLTSVTLIVSVPLAPCATDKVEAEAFRLKLPVELLPPHAAPFTAKFAGTELVTPFQVPLKPTPVTLPPAGTLPL
jgi:hypothetical protein